MAVFLSHRIERLVDLLAERLAEADLPPLSERWIVLPGTVMKQWLMIALTERMPQQAIAGLQILSWREAIIRLCRSPDPIPDGLELGLALADFFSKDALPDSFASLSDWLKDGGSARLSALVRPLSRQIRDAGFYGLDEGNEWQMDLYRELAVDGPWRFPVQLLPSAKLPPSVRQIHCFCLDELPPLAWEVLSKLCEDFSAYLFSPCRMFWEDICSDAERRHLTRKWKGNVDQLEDYLTDTHPLLANWGRLGRKTIKMLGDMELFDAYPESEEDLASAHEKFRRGELSLLQIVQQDLLFLRTVEDEPPYEWPHKDSSIEIVGAGSSLLREVQILKDNILRFLAGGKNYSDVLVLAPDIRLYEPLIHFVFGDAIPYRMAPVAVLPRNAYCGALRLFFGLADRRWEVDDVLELFENAAFLEKQRWTSDDLAQFRLWLQEAKVRGGWDQMKGNWADGLKSMLSGLIYLLPEEEGPLRIRSMDWGRADLLEQLFAIVDQLQTLSSQFQAQKRRGLEEWASLLSEAADALFVAKEGDEELFHSFLRKIAAAAPHFKKSSFPFSLLRSAFDEECSAATTAYQGMVLESIQFSSLQPGGIHPAKAVFLIGLDSEKFPRTTPRSSLDWAYKKPEELDRDCYLLLQALFSAEEHLSISYGHLSPDDGKLVEPSLPIQEFLQVLNRFYGENTAAALMTVHPTLPTDARYFQKGSALSSFSQEAFSAAKAPRNQASIFWPDKPLQSAETRVFDLADLMLLARHPWKYFLQKKVGIFLKEESLFSEMRLEDFTLPAYQERRWLRLALQRPVEEVIAQHAQEFPPGAFGSWATAQMRKRFAEWEGHLEKWGIAKDQIYSIRFSESCEQEKRTDDRILAPALLLESGVKIVGEIDLLAPSGLLMTSDGSFFSRLRNWPSFLASLMHSKTSSGSFYSLKAGTSKLLVEIDAPSALERWVDYAYRAQEMVSPLIDEWADSFLQKGEAEWKKAARQSVKREEDLAVRWILERSNPLPIERIWDHWGAYLQTTLAELKKGE